MPNPRIIVAGGSCQNDGGGIVPKGRGSVWLTELHTLPRVSLPAATWASAVLPKANRILSCSRLKPLKRGRSRSLAAAGARAPTSARAAGWRGPAGRASSPAGRGHKVSLPQEGAAAGRHDRQRHWFRQAVNGNPSGPKQRGVGANFHPKAASSSSSSSFSSSKHPAKPSTRTRRRTRTREFLAKLGSSRNSGEQRGVPWSCVMNI